MIVAGYILLCIFSKSFFFKQFSQIRENVPVIFQGVYFEVFISFVQCFDFIIKERCRPFNEGIIQQPIMSINKVITPMTELSDPPSYEQNLHFPYFLRSLSWYSINRSVKMRTILQTCVGAPFFKNAS